MSKLKDIVKLFDDNDQCPEFLQYSSVGSKINLKTKKKKIITSKTIFNTKSGGYYYCLSYNGDPLTERAGWSLSENMLQLLRNTFDFTVILNDVLNDELFLIGQADIFSLLGKLNHHKIYKHEVDEDRFKTNSEGLDYYVESL